MLLHTSVPKSKKKLAPKRVRQENEAWLQNLASMSTDFSRSGVKKVKISKSVPIPECWRQTPHHQSVDTGRGNATKPIKTMTYTGNNMIGIGTLHKSNAVPIFRQEDAVDMAKMRR